MRRPTSEVEDETEQRQPQQPPTSNNSIDEIYVLKKEKRVGESRFAKVKRIISGTLSLGSGNSRSPPSGEQRTTGDASKDVKKSVDATKMKSTRKRDRSRERCHQDIHQLSPDVEIGLKLTKLVEYEIKLQQNSNKQRETEVVRSSPKNIRKRKEHYEIISPPDQERKLIRSNSEERSLHIVNKELNAIKDMRRVSSHEDFQRKQQGEKQPLHEINHNEPSETVSDNIPLYDANFPLRNSPNKISPNRDPRTHFFNDQKFTSDFENEQERHRTSERFSRPLAPRGRSKIAAGKKRKSSRENREEERSESRITPSNVDADEKDRSIIEPLPLDFNTLHEQIDSSEPLRIDYSFAVTSEEDLNAQSISLKSALSSPRNSLILTRKIYLDPNTAIVEKQNSIPANPVEARIKHVSKQIAMLKKKLKKFDEQQHHDDKIGDRLSDKKMRGFMLELNKLKKELKCLKSDPMQMMYSAIASISDSVRRNTEPVTSDEASNKKRVELIQETVIEMEKRLAEKRQVLNRPEEISAMTDEQLIDEKVAVQKALLYLESIHGRPVTREDRDVARPLYDRYRVLKRNVARTSNAKMNNSIELGTILEHETMNFVSSPPERCTDEDTDAGGDEESSGNTPPAAGSMDSSDTDTSSINENLHALDIDELLIAQRTAREERKQLRRTLKEYEHEFEVRTGRKLQKDERTPLEGTYALYKQVKGRLKLIDILIEKKQLAERQ